jgi:hypothetical protein
MSLGARNSKRSRSPSPGLLFRGDRQGVAAPVREDGGGAETRRAARNERKQKTAVLKGVARPQAVKRSRARETRRQKKREPDACRNRLSAMEFGLGRERVPLNTQGCGAPMQTEAGEMELHWRDVEVFWKKHYPGRACRKRHRTQVLMGIDLYTRECSRDSGKINEFG